MKRGQWKREREKERVKEKEREKAKEERERERVEKLIRMSDSYNSFSFAKKSFFSLKNVE